MGGVEGGGAQDRPDADGLPIAADLVERIRAWQAVYDTRLDVDDAVTDPEIEAFSAEGADIACEVKRRLPDWTVVYFDEAGARRGGPWSRYEYEIV